MNVACIALTAFLALPPPLSAETLATVGSEAVTRVEFDVAAAVQGAGRALSRQERAQLLRSMVNQRLLVQEARARKLDRNPAVKARLKEAERRELAQDVYEAEIAAKSAVSAREAMDYYKANPGAFERAELGQILVAPRPGEDTAVAEKRVLRLKARLLKAPKRFAELAKAESDDPQSRVRGGDLGTLSRGMLEPELETAAFSAKPGSIVGPVRTRFGFHLLQVRGLRLLSWDEAGGPLRADMQRDRAQRAQQELLDRLSKTYKIEISKDAP